MKTKHFLPFIAMAIGMGSCTNDLVDETNPLMGKRDVIAVSVDNADTRTAMDGNNVVWSTSDAIGIFAGSMNNAYSLSSGAGTTSAEFTGLAPQSLKEAAYFPFVQDATWANNVISTTLPTAYTYSAESNNNAVMAALMAEDAQSSISFQNAGALYAITVENIPAGYDKAVMTYLDDEDNVGIAGAATITFVDEVPTLAVPEAADAASAEKTITITFTGTGSKTFYFPMPVMAESGFAGLQFSLQGTEMTTIAAPAYTKAPQRNKLYAETLTLDNVSGGIVTEAADVDAANAALANDAVTSVGVQEVEAGDEITIPAKSAESAAVAHTIDLSDATLPTGTDKVTISVDNTADETTVKELTVVVPDAATAGNLVINAPGTTVTIQAANGTVLDTIEAKTAENTLIIGEGVTIKKLVVMGGNVVLKGNVKNIESDVETTITLDEDITLAESIVFNGNNITLDMAGKTITSSGDGIEVVDGTLTITGNGRVNAGTTGGQWVAVWANGGDVVIENGTYSVVADTNNTTNDCIYAKGGQITINGGTFSNVGTYVPSNGGVVINANNDVANSTITINGGTFNPAEGCVPYEQKDVDAGRIELNNPVMNETELKIAVAAGKNVKFGTDITVESTVVVTKDLTIDLNGKTLTSKQDGFEVTAGTLTITGNGTVNAGTTGGQWVAVWANGGDVVIENGTYSVVADTNNTTNDCIYAKGGQITINGGTFSNVGTYVPSNGGVVINANNDVANSTITINGGTFNPAEGCVAYEQKDVEAERVIINTNN